jgi:hypothetical protein
VQQIFGYIEDEADIIGFRLVRAMCGGVPGLECGFQSISVARTQVASFHQAIQLLLKPAHVTYPVGHIEIEKGPRSHKGQAMTTRLQRRITLVEQLAHVVLELESPIGSLPRDWGRKIFRFVYTRIIREDMLPQAHGAASSALEDYAYRVPVDVVLNIFDVLSLRDLSNLQYIMLRRSQALVAMHPFDLPLLAHWASR